MLNMKRFRFFVIPALVCAAMLSACEGAGNKQIGGTVVGGALGGLLGSKIGSGRGQLVGVGLGALLGAFLGSETGKSLDKADEAYARQTAQHAFETTPAGTRTQWHNPDTGNTGTITPTKTYENPDGSYCREFQQTITVGGKSESAYGTACRQPDGSWKMSQ